MSFNAVVTVVEIEAGSKSAVEPGVSTGACRTGCRNAGESSGDVHDCFLVVVKARAVILSASTAM